MIELGIIAVLAVAFVAIAMVSINPHEVEDDLDQIRSVQQKSAKPTEEAHGNRR